MVCSSCREAGKVCRTDPALAGEFHGKCPGGTWCDGQKIIPGSNQATPE